MSSGTITRATKASTSQQKPDKCTAAPIATEASTMCSTDSARGVAQVRQRQAAGVVLGDGAALG